MKLSKISLALAALTSVAAMPAFALTASSYSASNSYNIYVSGATAQDSALNAAVFSPTVCTANTIHTYTISNQRVILCTPSANYQSGVPVAQQKSQLAVYKHSVGGSGNGVGPINSGATLPFLDLGLINTNCSAATGAGTSIACDASTAAALTSPAVAQLGISDVEPAFFGPKSSYNNLTASPLATVIFGVPVTTNIYSALQEKQYGTTACPQTAAVGTNPVVPNSSATCIPSLSSAQLSTLYTKEETSWNGVTGVTAATDDQVYVARRVNTSGTQKVFEALVARAANGDSSGKSCYGQLYGFLSGVDAIDNTAANAACDGSNLVIQGSGSGQVQACLNKLNTSGKRGIGVLTTEQVSGTNFKFVRVNGLLPNYTNVISGAHTLYGDATINFKTVGTDAAHLNFKTKFFPAFAATPTAHPAFGSGTDAQGGLIELKVASPSAANPNPFQRLDTDGNVDNCIPGTTK